MSVLDVAAIQKIMDRLDAIPLSPVPYIITSSRGAEKLRGCVGTIPVFTTEYVPKPFIAPLPRRRQYATRAGFKKARNYRRWYNRKLARTSDETFGR